MIVCHYITFFLFDINLHYKTVHTTANSPVRDTSGTVLIETELSFFQMLIFSNRGRADVIWVACGSMNHVPSHTAIVFCGRNVGFGPGLAQDWVAGYLQRIIPGSIGGGGADSCKTETCLFTSYSFIVSFYTSPGVTSIIWLPYLCFQ